MEGLYVLIADEKKQPIGFALKEDAENLVSAVEWMRQGQNESRRKYFILEVTSSELEKYVHKMLHQ